MKLPRTIAKHIHFQSSCIPARKILHRKSGLRFLEILKTTIGTVSF
ncbi:hypothetical protein ACFP3I_11920 [Chryseobacterium arachidis]